MQRLFISFEGIDGVGKTTQIQLLEKWFCAQQYPVLRTREPGGTLFGCEIRTLLFTQTTLSARAEAFLFQADRAEHVDKVIRPALEKGVSVLSDRFIDSSSVYQGIRKNLSIDLIQSLSLFASENLLPDITFLLDLDPKERYQTEKNHFDREDILIHAQMREAFLALARRYQERFIIINASQSPEKVHHCILEHTKRVLFERKNHE